MEACQRRYTRNLIAEAEILPGKPMTKEQIRRALIERRTIIGPNGEKFQIPKHMALDDMITYFKSEFGLTHAEVTQVMAAAELLTKRPEYRGKLNRIVIDGAENPLRIVIPKGRADKQKAQEIIDVEVVKDQPVQEIKTEGKAKHEEEIQLDFPIIRPRKQAPSRPFVEDRPSLEISIKNPSRDAGVYGYGQDAKVIPFDRQRRTVRSPRTSTYTVQNPEDLKRNNQIVNAIVADRIRAGRAEEKRLEAQRIEQSKNLAKQMRAHDREKEMEAQRKSKNRLALVAAVAFLFVTGLVVDVVETIRNTNITVAEINPPGIHETVDRSMFNVTPQTIGNFTGDINLIPISQKTNMQNSSEYQPWEYSIDSVSQGVKQNTNLTNVLNRYSQNSENPVVIGEIASYQEFEQLLQNDDEALYTSGPVYFANFSRQMLHGLLKDKYGADRVSATYEKIGENNQNYEFYIRYYKNGSSSERTPEGRVVMKRNAEGRLQTNEYHTLPYEVYEMLAIIGEFTDFTDKENPGAPFDIQGYADRFTNGDVNKAKEELKSRMTYGMEAMKTLLKERVRTDKVDYYRYGGR